MILKESKIDHVLGQNAENYHILQMLQYLNLHCFKLNKIKAKKKTMDFSHKQKVL